jgi:uncharacterized protein (DUF2235 family)
MARLPWETGMAKNILFFADGTWNSPGQDQDGDGVPDPTNVVKLFGVLQGRDDVSSLPLQHEQERTLLKAGKPVQVAKYLHGVGDSRNWLVRVLGGAFGAGVVARIARGYTFISRNYQPGDRITLVGFSRGAYTVRALAGMITGQGLLDGTKLDLADDRQEAYRAATAAWQHYREKVSNTARRGMLTSVLRDLPVFAADDSVTGQLTGPVPVQCVAVWDTVGALGIPFYTGQDERVDAFRFCDTQLNERVVHGYHAVAIDEQRRDFLPTLWEPRGGVEQVLFAGAHADVGGGYPMARGESDLAHLSLQWMADCLRAEGVLLDPLPDAYAGSAFGGTHRPWLETVWLGRPTGRREFGDWRAKGMRLHESALARMEGKGPFTLYASDREDRYQPANVA